MEEGVEVYIHLTKLVRFFFNELCRLNQNKLKKTSIYNSIMNQEMDSNDDLETKLKVNFISKNKSKY